MTGLFSTLVGAAMGTPESLIETATPLLRPRFADTEVLGNGAEAAIVPIGPAEAALTVPPQPAFALDMPAASAPQSLLPPLAAEAVQAGPAPITPVLASESPAATPLTPALVAPAPPPAMVNAPFLPEQPAISTLASPVLPAISAAGGDEPAAKPAPIMAELVGSTSFLPSTAPAAAPSRHLPETNSPAPSIAIHIGRIEVASPAPVAAPASRTTSAAPPSATRAPTISRAAPRQSLDSYLGQRRR